MSNNGSIINKKFIRMSLSIVAVVFVAVISIILIVSKNLSAKEEEMEGEYDVCGIGA